MRKKKAQKITTIDGLARLMQGEFLSVGKRFDGVDKRFDGVDKRFDGVDKRLDIVEQRLTTVEYAVKEMRENSSELFGKLDRFISLYEAQRKELTILANQVERLEARIEELERKR